MNEAEYHMKHYGDRGGCYPSRPYYSFKIILSLKTKLKHACLRSIVHIQGCSAQALVDCARQKSILCFQQCSYFIEIMPKLRYFLKIMLSVTEIMLLIFYTDFKENKDHQQLNSINFDFNEHSYSPPSSLTVFSVANTHVRT